MTFQPRNAILLALVGGMLFAPARSAADDLDPVQRGRQIAAEADRRARGFDNYKAEMTMTLSDRRGETKERKLETSSLEASADTTKSLVVFDSPRDIRGTALLSYSHSGKDDEQWLYLPALRRTKQIAATNRSTPFMGSEFAYEDLASTYVDDYTYRYVRSERYRGTDCYVIERYPQYDGSGYRKQRVWLDTAEYRVLKIEFWDRDGDKLKTLVLGGYDRHLDRFWMPGEARMLNHQSKAMTTLTWSRYQFHAGLGPSDFNQSALRRAR